ncbi:MAG TPA: tetratricopeptide repeat protein [Verrucomicrobiae bacterium]|nr:tetratricopeptide repeat protein [Verrucomicrobiae bacterium]
MLFRSGFWIMALAAGSLLAAGCRAPFNAAEFRDPARSGISQMPPGKRPFGNSKSADTYRANPVEAHAHFATGIVYELNGESERALEEYFKAAMDDLENEPLVLEVSRQLLKAKKSEQALELLTRATAHPGASANLFARLGFIYAQLGRQDSAVRAARIAVRREPDSLVGYQNLFLIFMRNEKAKDALNVLDKAAKVSRVSPEFLVGLGELYGSYSLQVPGQKSVARARGLAVLKRAEKSKIAAPELELRLADAFNLLGQNDESAKLYQEVLEKLPATSYLRETVRAKLTDIYLRGNKTTRAAEQLENIIRDNPTDAQAYYLLGNIAYTGTNYSKAIEQFSKVILLSPDFEPVYYDMAGAQISDDKPADALATLEKARTKFPQNFIVDYLAAMAYDRLNDFTNAVSHFNAAEIFAKVNDQKRLNDLFYFQFGAACERAGNLALAETNFLECLALSPNFSEAQNYLGFMWADHGMNLDRARELIARAVKAEPKNAAYLDSMGWVLYKLKQPKQALGYVLDAIKYSEEEDATLYDHLGDIYSALDQPQKARDAWRKSLSLEANEMVRKKLETSRDKARR